MRRGFAITFLLFVLSASASAGDESDCRELKAEYEGKDLFLQYNLRTDDGEQHWVNFMKEGDYYGIGSEVRVLKLKSDEAVLLMKEADEEVELDLDEPQPDCKTILSRMLGPTPPSLDGLSQADVDGIKRAAIATGMTRRGVFLAVGYPPYFYERPWSETTVTNHDMNASELSFVGSTYDLVIVQFEDDVVKSIDD